MKKTLIWIEINKSALIHNIKLFRNTINKKVVLAPSVKANAYGHGLVQCGKILLKNGADWLSVNSLFEAELLRAAGIKSRIYIKGYIQQSDLSRAVEAGVDLVVYNKETVHSLSRHAKKQKKKMHIHIKIETGNNRQGVMRENLLDFAEYIGRYPELVIEGLATHFADIEDSVDQKYANYQIRNFDAAIEELRTHGIEPPRLHCANSAATLLFERTHYTMVRPGIAIYGLWPSELVKNQIKKVKKVSLQPVLSWKTRIAQIKEIPKGSAIGYGCTYVTKQKTRLAILPVGYYDGYDRGLSNNAWVLIRGKKAPVRGRVCMNIIMVDVTKIPAAQLEDEVTLLGRDGKVTMTTDTMAALADTINYEIPTRIRESVPRIIV